jgi:tetratricopeptide (TPR) repeat protein
MMTQQINSLLDKANTALSKSNWQTAADLYAELALLLPDQADVHHVHGLVLKELAKHDTALACIDKAIRLSPYSAGYHRSRGEVLQDAGRLDDAATAYQRALHLNPNDTDAMINLGNTLHSQDNLETARQWFQNALSIDPINIKAINNLGKVFSDENKLDLARQWLDKAVEIDPSYAEARFNRAAVLLAMGDFQNGWQDYEFRFLRRAASRVYPHTLTSSRWDGSPYPSQRLLVHCEQGLGDVIHFCRYLPMVKSFGGTLIVEAQRPLLPLLRAMASIDELVAFDPAAPPLTDHDLHVPLLSLPLIFQTRPDTIPGTVPYLRSDPQKTDQWRSHLGDGEFRVGVVWAGSDVDPRRTCTLTKLASWFTLPRVRFYSLQKGVAQGQVDAMSHHANLIHLGDQLNDFSDTAAVIANLDLVISIDTAVAHLAGALGKPVWVLLPLAPDWRWQLRPDDTPWYPSARLFRQEERNDWQALIDSVGTALKRAVAQHTDLSPEPASPGPSPSIDPEAWHCYESGKEHFDSGNFEEASTQFQKAITLRAKWDDAHFLLGCAFHEWGKQKPAIRAYLEAVRLNPNLEAAFRHLGLAFHQVGNLKKSAANYEQALNLQPNQPAVVTNLGVVYQRLRKTDRAADCYRRALAGDPSYAPAHYNLGTLRLNQAKLEEAEEHFNHALAYNPKHLNALGNLGRTHQRLGHPDKAIALYDKALSMNADQPVIRVNRATALLSKGDWEAGWQEYEWRFRLPDRQRIYPHRLAGPRWQGGPFKSKTLLVHSEQGIGDALQFARFLPMVKSLGGRVVFEVRASLTALLETIEGVDEIVTLSADTPPQIDYDAHVPLCSLAGIFNTQPDTIPNHVPYLSADPHKVAVWQKRIKQDDIHVGIVWAGNDTYPERSCLLGDMAPLMDVKNVEWIGLQKGPAALQATGSQRPDGFEVENWGEAFEEFSDTAAAVATLDLVISIDTSVAHLAGAMGKPVWVMLPAVADWRWLRDREDSPWYPTMRLFRQKRLGDWSEVIHRIADALKHRAPNNSNVSMNEASAGNTYA